MLRVDVNLGDPVTPAPVEVEFPSLLEGPFQLRGYPLATVLAEKVVTMIDRGVATTRERDFADVVLLARRHPVAAEELLAAMRATADHRGSTLRPLAGYLEPLGPARQASWLAYLTRSGLANLVPSDYANAIDEVGRFLDPLLSGAVRNGTWDPFTQSGVDGDPRSHGARSRPPCRRAVNQNSRAEEPSGDQAVDPWRPQRQVYGCTRCDEHTRVWDSAN